VPTRRAVWITIRLYSALNEGTRMSINKLKKENFLDQVSRYGFFAEQFPSCFSTEQFADNLLSLAPLVSSARGEQRNTKKNTTSPATLSMYKNDISRRILSVPNPEAFLRLAKYIGEHWDEILEHCKSKQSLSPIYFIKPYDGGVKELINCESIREVLRAKSDYIVGIKQCIRTSLGCKYRMKVDIANCYNSIYTHSITWAICEKGLAKSYFRNKEPADLKDTYEMADCLDTFTRFQKNNETNGIIVGPFTSRIISEIILARIDKMLSDRGFVFKRYVDDYKFYFRSEAQAHESLAIIEKVLNEFNLALNTSKTEIQKYPYETISQIKETYDAALEKDGIFGVLNAASILHLAGEKGAYKYALKYIRGVELPRDDNLQIIIPTLINIMLLDPKYGKYVTAYLKENLDNINADALTNTFNKELQSSLHGELQQETLLFAQMIKDLELKISAENMLGILCSDNDFAIIIALDIWKNRNKSVMRTPAEAKSIKAAIRELATSLSGEKLSGARWLLLYEIVLHQLVPTENMPAIEFNAFFEKMSELNISFYKGIC